MWRADAAAPAEAVMSSGSSSASPGALEAGIGLIPVSSLPRVPESQSSPRKRSLPLGDIMESPETPNTRFRAQLTGGRFSTGVYYPPTNNSGRRSMRQQDGPRTKRVVTPVH